MHSLGINGEGELRGQMTNRGSPGTVAVKTEFVCVLRYCGYLLLITDKCGRALRTWVETRQCHSLFVVCQWLALSSQRT